MKKSKTLADSRLKVFFLYVLLYCLSFLHALRIVSRRKKKKYGLLLLCKIRTIKYWENKVANNKVIYSCMTGDYDGIITHKYVNNRYDYVFFTDSETLLKKNIVGVWQIKPLQKNFADNILNNRWHKMMPHQLFPEYDTSIYVDANCDIISDYLFKQVESVPLQVSMAFSPHYARVCVYEEMDACIQYRKESLETIEKIKSKYQLEGMPHNYGLTENGILFRRHNNFDCVESMDAWWECLCNLSRRDQLSLMYIFWKKGLFPYYFTSIPYASDNQNFILNPHRRQV